MNLNKHAHAKPNIVGLTSPLQQVEMKLIVAGRWPPLKPLPVFKYETEGCRASIEFDKTRGEWFCRKTSLLSNNVQELRGGLIEITLALPHGQAEEFTESLLTEQQEQESERESDRRRQTLLKWRENYESGAFYSELRDYLSESQQQEIDESIRLSLTARQLQFNPKNVAYVFDALSKAGGRLTTLIEIAQRNKAGREANASALQASSPSGFALDFAPEPTNTFVPGLAEQVTPAPLESLLPAVVENSPTELMETVLPEQGRPSSPEPIAHATSPASQIVTTEIAHAGPPSFAKNLGEQVRHRNSARSVAQQARTYKVESSATRIEDFPSRSSALEISGFQVAALAFVILFAVMSLAVGLTVGRGPLGQHLRDAQNSIRNVLTKSPALPDRQGQTASQTSALSVANNFNAPPVNPPGPELDDATPSEESSNEGSPDSASFAKNPNSSLTKESKPSIIPQPSPEDSDSTGLISRSAPPPASPQPAHSPSAHGPLSGATRNPAPRTATPATGATPHSSPPSSILVRVPPKGSKPFRVMFREKPVAASSSFAITSQLSVLVSPQPGIAVAHKPSRLQAGELVSFVWPRYPGPGDRYGSPETIKVRATIGKFGQVQNMTLVRGPVALFPGAIAAIRLWRFKPTLLNKTPVQAQQDITIEFRPPQFLSHLATQHPLPN